MCAPGIRAFGAYGQTYRSVTLISNRNRYYIIMETTIVSHFLPELAYAAGRNSHFMRFYGDQTQFLPDPVNPHETSVYEKLRKYRV